MLAVIAAILFALGFLVYATSADVPTVFAPMSLLLVGLVLLSLHQAGFGTAFAWNGTRRTARRR